MALPTNPQELIRLIAVWQKGAIIPGYEPTMWRRDAYRWPMRWTDYGNRNSDFGWEVDHIRATVLGGSDGFANLRPLHCRNNASLGGQLSGLGS